MVRLSESRYSYCSSWSLRPGSPGVSVRKPRIEYRIAEDQVPVGSLHEIIHVKIVAGADPLCEPIEPAHELKHIRVKVCGVLFCCRKPILAALKSQQFVDGITVRMMPFYWIQPFHFKQIHGHPKACMPDDTEVAMGLGLEGSLRCRFTDQVSMMGSIRRKLEHSRTAARLEHHAEVSSIHELRPLKHRILLNDLFYLRI